MNTNVLKYILAFCFLCLTHVLPAQVGINAKNYSGGTFFIDAAGDNSATPVATQIANDVLISTTGRLGVGTIAPTTQLHIEGSTANPVLRIVDGTQTQGRVLTSKADGEAHWQPFGAVLVKNIPLGAAKQFTITDITSRYIYSNTSVTLPPGLWLIEVNILVYRVSGTAATDFTIKTWLQTFMADTNTGQSITVDGYGNGYSGRMACNFMYLKNNGFNMINGFFVINNKTGANKTYYYMFGSGGTYPVASSVTSATTFSFGGPANESTIFATYIDEPRP
ncbi:hypothetical protein CLV62_1434 [Dysgonomonas alginatilytica]|uniref:Uncharacterized protein n=1 Tax=Dysgonomonas alginatilytica TaxID=1605892 RepID=A0A2V3PIP4_9BACT|nr:hypothetical protein [Dysgonomonas alginatilytica]PXV58824.1 hypothetical protein CLV62_1434 [Dysgonomonas alginatilytica]